MSLQMRKIARVTPITADPSCKEQNNAGLMEYLQGPIFGL